MAELRPHVEELRRIGVAPYVIGSGTPEQARAFGERVAPGLPILSDERLVSYRAAGMKRGAAATLSLRGLPRYLGAFFHHPQRRTQGDPWQLGGAMIVTPAGEVAFHYVGQHGGDHPAPSLLVDEARKAMK